jgi:rhomboid protease GluP
LKRPPKYDAFSPQIRRIILMGRRLHDLSEVSGNLAELRRRRPPLATSSSQEHQGGGPPPTETFAAYFGRYLMEERDYELLPIPELDQLTAQADLVLTHSDGFAFSVAAIFDREARPTSRLTMRPDELHRIGDRCQQYVGTINGYKIPVSIEVFEVGPDVLRPADRERLHPYRPYSDVSTTKLTAWLFDTATNVVWGNRFMMGLWRRRYTKLLQSPRLNRPPIAEAPPKSLVQRIPWFALAMALLLTAIFTATVHLSSGSLWMLSPIYLEDLGGIIRSGASNLEMWRLLTAPFLHASLTHLLINTLMLLWMASSLEPLVGWRWTSAIFAAGALAGSLMSAAFIPASVVSVGASGGVVALFAATFPLSSRIRQKHLRIAVLMQATLGLVPAILPFQRWSGAGVLVDYSAHIGGAAAGLLVGLVIRVLWPRSAPSPRGKWPAIVLGIAVPIASTASLCWRLQYF